MTRFDRYPYTGEPHSSERLPEKSWEVPDYFQVRKEDLQYLGNRGSPLEVGILRIAGEEPRPVLIRPYQARDESYVWIADVGA